MLKNVYLDLTPGEKKCLYGIFVIQPSLLTNARIFAVERCTDRDVRKIFDLIHKYKKITKFVEDLLSKDKSLALKFVLSLPNNILRIYTSER